MRPWRGQPSLESAAVAQIRAIHRENMNKIIDFGGRTFSTKCGISETVIPGKSGILSLNWIAWAVRELMRRRFWDQRKRTTSETDDEEVPCWVCRPCGVGGCGLRRCWPTSPRGPTPKAPR